MQREQKKSLWVECSQNIALLTFPYAFWIINEASIFAFRIKQLLVWYDEYIPQPDQLSHVFQDQYFWKILVNQWKRLIILVERDTSYLINTKIMGVSHMYRIWYNGKKNTNLRNRLFPVFLRAPSSRNDH
jgi:hypothetical protein